MRPIRRLKLRRLHRKSEQLRAEWKAVGSPDSGPERSAMIAAFVDEAIVRYRKALEKLAEND